MLKALPLERLYRDSRCGSLMLPWTAELCLDRIGREALYEPGETRRAVSLARWIERHAAFTPDKAALRFEDEALTYAALGGADPARSPPGCGASSASGAATGSPGSASITPTCWRCCSPARGWARSWCRSTGASPRRELRAILADAEPKALFAEAGLRARIEAIARRPGCRLIARDFAAAGWTPLAALLEQAHGAQP